jgi:hypothetical protein
MDELTATAPKRKMERTNSELATLTQLLADLNNPHLTGAQLPPEEKAKLAPAMTMVEPEKVLPKQEDPPPASPPPVPDTAPPDPVLAPVLAPSKPTRFILTGRSGSGKEYIAAQMGANVVNLTAPIWKLVETYFAVPSTTPSTAEFVATIEAWGRGQIDSRYPMTPERLLFVDWIRGKWDGLFQLFGQPMFWTNLLLADLDNTVPQRAVVTDVKRPEEFKRLQAAGFVHYHVTCSPGTLAARVKSGGDDAMAAHLDHDVTKKISAQRVGPMLRCIWNDTAPQPSARLHTLASFLQEIAL